MPTARRCELRISPTAGYLRGSHFPPECGCLSHSDALAPCTGHLLRDHRDDLNIERQEAVIKSALDHAVIAPGTPGSWSLDIGRVQPHWKV